MSKNMGIIFKFCLFLSTVVSSFGISEEYGLKNEQILSRRRRHVTFPDGSSFSCAGCMTVGVIGQPMSVPGTFTFGMNWGIAYELPNSTETLDFYHKKYHGHFKAMAQRRSRRDLYRKLETILENIGYDGRQCVLKTLCETKQRIIPKGSNMIEEMFRTIFTLPLSRVLPTEPTEHSIYDAAYRLSNMLEDCDAYPCPISLVDLAKGYYNAPGISQDSPGSMAPWTILNNSFR